MVTTVAAGAGTGDFDGARRLGVGLVREELDWRTVQPRPGTWRWTGFDRVVAGAAARRLRVLPLLLTTPRWLSPQPLRLPPDLGAWAAFVALAAARYGPGGVFWRSHPRLDPRLAPPAFELWNEPYFEVFSAGGVDAARYARVYAAGARAGRAANPRARFLLAAETGYTAADGTARSWIADVFAAVPDLGRWVDGAAVHPYTTQDPWSGTGPPRGRLGRMLDVRDDLRRRGAGADLWLTEVGWTTCARGPRCVTEAQQAGYLRRLLAQVSQRTGGAVRAVVIFRLTSYHAPPGTDPAEAAFGLLRPDGSPKPAWAAVHRAALRAPPGG